MIIIIIIWWWTNGVNTNGAAAEVINFDRLGETKVRPGTFGKIKVGKREYQQKVPVKKHVICSDPISADPISPFPIASELRPMDCRLGSRNNAVRPRNDVR